MTLKQSKVVFNEEAHTYTLKGKKLSGVTPIVSWLFPETYHDIPTEVLNNAAARGSNVHKYCQMIDNLGIVPPEAPGEAKAYLDLCAQNGYSSVANEYLVSDNKDIASSIDVVMQTEDCAPTEVDLMDIKTTSQIHKDNVLLQLSIYAYLFEKMNKGLKARKLCVIWLPKPQYGTPKIVECAPRIDAKTCKEIIKAYVNGESSERFRCLFGGVAKTNTELPAQVVDAEKQIIQLDAILKDIKEKKEALQNGLLELMKQNGVKKYESDRMIITYVAPTSSSRIDSARLKAEYPNVYEDCVKMSETKESIRIKIK